AAGEWSWWRSILFVWSVAARAAWCYLLAGHGGYWRTDVRLPGRARAPARRRWPSVAAVVPARDEAAILPETLPTLLAQDYPGAFRVVLVDDASSDGTGAAAAALGAAASGEPVPAAPGVSRGGAVSTLGDAVSTRAGSVLRVVGGTPPRAGPGGGDGGGVRLPAVYRRRYRLRAGNRDRPGPRGRRGRPGPGLPDGDAAGGNRLGTVDRSGVRVLLRAALPVPVGRPPPGQDRRRGRRLHAGAARGAGGGGRAGAHRGRPDRPRGGGAAAQTRAGPGALL